MDQVAIARWVATAVLPHEPDVRAWLRRALVRSQDVDDVIHEAYCRLAELQDVAHITQPRAYFFQTVRNVVFEEVRRARVVRIERVVEAELLKMPDEAPQPDRIVSAHHELARVRKLIQALPDRCRRVFELRKIQGLSQREVARALGETEHAVEKQTAKGLRLILDALGSESGQSRASETHARRNQGEHHD